MSNYRIGIVGTGGIANSHIQGYRAVLGDLGEVMAGCDPDTDRLQAYCDKYEVKHRFADAQDMIDSDEVDVLALLTPPAVRHEIIFPAIDKGLHLLVEKPFGETYADARSFVEAAEQVGTVLAVNQSLRFMPDILATHELVAQDTIGEVRYIAHDHFQNRTRTSGWRRDEERLEISIFSIHILDRIRWICGSRPEAVSATTRHWCDDVRGESFCSLNIQFEGGGVGTMVSNWHSLTIPQCRLRIDGTKGSLVSERQSATANAATLTLHPLNGEPEQRSFSRERASTMNMGESMKELLLAAKEERQPHHSGRDNLQTMAIVDAAYLSASRGGTRVDIAEIVGRD